MTISAADIAVKTEWRIPLDKWERATEQQRAYWREHVAHAEREER